MRANEDDRFFWARRTWPEVREAIESGKLVALLPVGATEAHGPHLALDTDVAIAEEVALRAARALEGRGEAGRRALVLPPIAYTVTRFAGEFAGTLGIGEPAVRHVLDDLFTALALWGVCTLAIVNHHLEPAHVELVREAAVAAPKRLRIAFPDHTRKPHALALGDEFRSGDCHAGRYETSLALAIDARRVREAERARLEPRWLGLVAGMRAGKRTFGEIGMDAAYVGDPRAASTEEGELLLETLAHIVVEDVLKNGS